MATIRIEISGRSLERFRVLQKLQEEQEPGPIIADAFRLYEWALQRELEGKKLFEQNPDGSYAEVNVFVDTTETVG